MAPDEDSAMRVVAFCRHFFARMAQEQQKVGARVEDIAIGSIYAAVDVAQAHTGDPIAAIEWARTALDVMERSLMSPETVQ